VFEQLATGGIRPPTSSRLAERDRAGAFSPVLPKHGTRLGRWLQISGRNSRRSACLQGGGWGRETDQGGAAYRATSRTRPPGPARSVRRQRPARRQDRHRRAGSRSRSRGLGHEHELRTRAVKTELSDQRGSASASRGPVAPIAKLSHRAINRPSPGWGHLSI
jgi:hypothetical protein